MLQRNGYRRLQCSASLTEVERAILAAYAAGYCRAEIACQVGLAERTVGTYLTTAKEKLGARNLAHAAALSSFGAAEPARGADI